MTIWPGDAKILESVMLRLLVSGVFAVSTWSPARSATRGSTHRRAGRPRVPLHPPPAEKMRGEVAGASLWGAGSAGGARPWVVERPRPGGGGRHRYGLPPHQAVERGRRGPVRLHSERGYRPAARRGHRRPAGRAP